MSWHWKHGVLTIEPPGSPFILLTVLSVRTTTHQKVSQSQRGDEELSWRRQLFGIRPVCRAVGTSASFIINCTIILKRSFVILPTVIEFDFYSLCHFWKSDELQYTSLVQAIGGAHLLSWEDNVPGEWLYRGLNQKIPRVNPGYVILDSLPELWHQIAQLWFGSSNTHHKELSEYK